MGQTWCTLEQYRYLVDIGEMNSIFKVSNYGYTGKE